MDNVRNAKWLDSSHTRLDCIYYHPALGWVPFTASIYDQAPAAKEIFRNIRNITVAEYTAPETDLEVLRENKHLELKAKRDMLRATERVAYDGDTFGVDKDTDQVNMNTFYTQAIAMVSGTVERHMFTWMSATNNSHDFTPEQIIELAQLMQGKVQEIYGKYWYARDILLAQATTAEEIKAISL